MRLFLEIVLESARLFLRWIHNFTRWLAHWLKAGLISTYLKSPSPLSNFISSRWFCWFLLAALQRTLRKLFTPKSSSPFQNCFRFWLAVSRNYIKINSFDEPQSLLKMRHAILVQLCQIGMRRMLGSLPGLRLTDSGAHLMMRGTNLSLPICSVTYTNSSGHWVWVAGDQWLQATSVLTLFCRTTRFYSDRGVKQASKHASK